MCVFYPCTSVDRYLAQMMHVNSLIEHVTGLIGAVMYCCCYKNPTGALFVLAGMTVDWHCLTL